MTIPEPTDEDLAAAIKRLSSLMYQTKTPDRISRDFDIVIHDLNKRIAAERERDEAAKLVKQMRAIVEVVCDQRDRLQDRHDRAVAEFNRMLYERNAANGERDDLRRQLAEAEKVIADRGICERDCSLPLAQRIDNIIVDLRNDEHKFAEMQADCQPKESLEGGGLNERMTLSGEHLNNTHTVLLRPVPKEPPQ